MDRADHFHGGFQLSTELLQLPQLPAIKKRPDEGETTGFAKAAGVIPEK